VLVAFLDGDVDQPVVVGALHNGRDTAPFPVGESTRRSGFRSQSIGGDGHNELSFEDLHGREEVYLHAQRNLREEVRQDRSANVLGSHALTVGGSVTTQVGGAVRVTIDGQGSSHTAAHVEGRGEITVSCSNQLRLTSPQSIVLVCGDAQLAMTPDELTLNVGDTRIKLTAARLDVDSAEVFVTGGTKVDLQAGRINLNSREGT
jgi:type VI secretion system secreted protein VgrG